LVGEKLPFFALTIGSIIVTVWAQKTGGAVRSLAEIPLGLRLENALVSYLLYVRKLFWPSDLAVFYPHPKAIAFWQAGAAALVLGAASWLVLRQAGKRPWLSVGWLWYLGTLVPVLGLMQVGWLSGADRYTYIPLIGLFVMLAWGGVDWAGERPRARAGVVVVGLIGLVACAGMSWRQAQFWRDSKTLFARALQVTDENYVAHQSLGTALGGEGELGAAELHLKEALRIEPRFPAAENNLGTVLFKGNRLEEAAVHYRRAITLRAGYAEVHENLGLVYARLGKPSEALIEFERALEIEPTRPAAHFQAYLILASQNRMAEAIAHLEQAVRAAPGEVEGLAALAWVLATEPDGKCRDGQRAVVLAERAADLTGRQDARVLSILAAAYAESGRFDEAISTAERAQRLCLADGQTGRADSIARKLDFYRRKQPYHATRRAESFDPAL
jgi:tetratricopeptide (TPR) repeat protein